MKKLQHDLPLRRSYRLLRRCNWNGKVNNLANPQRYRFLKSRLVPHDWEGREPPAHVKAHVYWSPQLSMWVCSSQSRERRAGGTVGFTAAEAYDRWQRQAIDGASV